MKRYRRNKGPKKVAPLPSSSEACSSSALGESKRPHNVVDALFNHFAKWKPEVIKDATSIQEMRQTCGSQGEVNE